LYFQTELLKEQKREAKIGELLKNTKVMSPRSDTTTLIEKLPLRFKKAKRLISLLGNIIS